MNGIENKQSAESTNELKIAVLGGYEENPGDLSWNPIAELGDLTIYDRVPDREAEIIERAKDADILLINKAHITKAVIDACPNIKYMSVLATGYDNVDGKYARSKGIPVSNVPAYGTASVAQFAIALLLEICGHVQHHSDAVHEGRWLSSPYFYFWDYPLIELSGKTMGIIGFGRIGRAVGTIAKALGMRVIAYNRSECDEGRQIGEYVSLNTLLNEADVISLHCPLNDDNRDLINRDTIAKMKDGVILINNSRGGLVVDQDLADALNSGRIYAAGLDVISTEPIPADNPLLTAKNCLITPHISWAPKESRQRIMDCTAENIKAFLEGKPRNVVN